MLNASGSPLWKCIYYIIHKPLLQKKTFDEVDELQFALKMCSDYRTCCVSVGEKIGSVQGSYHKSFKTFFFSISFRIKNLINFRHFTHLCIFPLVLRTIKVIELTHFP